MMLKPYIYKFLRYYLIISVVSSSLSTLVYANPQHQQTVEGNVTIVENGTNLTVHQSSDKAVIEWASFDISSGEHTHFQQPSANSVTLNRVNSLDPSTIAGSLTANGNIILVNPNGVFFDSGSSVDVNGLVVSSSDIQNNDFMAGNLHFSQPGAPDAAIVNAGSITVKEAGLAALVAPNVSNSGTINAKLARVQLASADSFSVDLYGDGLYELKISDQVSSQLVSHAGIIEAEGGSIAITAAAGRDMVNSLITIQGELKAPKIEQQGGKIIIAAAGSENVAGNSSVVVSNAYLDVSGQDDGEQGGEIEITADYIAMLGNNLLDASGHSSPSSSTTTDTSGTATLTADKQVRTEEAFLSHQQRAGGSIKIGGDYLGSGDTARATSVYVGENTYLINDALVSGDAGRTIVWSDDTTVFYGNVFARGGQEGGNGGFLETSGKMQLTAQGYADLTNRADGYAKGTYLLDPDNITIYGNVDPTFISTDSTIDLGSNLVMWLDSADATQVTLTYSNNDLGSATITGTAGTNTLNTDLDLTDKLEVGARIRIGNSGDVTTADVLGADTYTITAISGTTITVEETLTTTYTSDDLYRGLVSEWSDKAANNNAVQTNEAQMPLWLAAGENREASILFMGNQYLETQNIVEQQTTVIAAEPEAGNGDDNMGMFSAATATLNNLDYSFYFLDVHGLGEADTNINDETGFGFVNWANDTTSISPDITNRTNSVIFSWDQTSTGIAYLNINGDLPDLYFINDPNTISQPASHLNNPNIDWQTVTIGAARVQAWAQGSQFFTGEMPEVISYSTALSVEAQSLIGQYQSTKWGIDLDTPGTGATEIASATATDGYSVFTTDYLEKLSGTADIVLQANNNITLDLQGDTLNLDTDRSITLNATNGEITDVSNGTIQTTRSGTGGNITLNAGGKIDLDTTNLEALNGGVVSMISDAAVSLKQNSLLTIGQIQAKNANTITLSAVNGIIDSNSAVVQTSGADITLESSNGSIDLDTTNLQGGTVNLDAADSVTVVQNSDLTIGEVKANTGNIELTSSTGSIVLDNADLETAGAGDISLTAANDLTDTGSGFIKTNGGDISLESSNGSIDLGTSNLEGGTVNLDAESSVSLVQNSDLTIGEVKANTGDIALTSSTGSIVLDNADLETSGTGDINLTAANDLTDTGSGSIKTNSGDISLESSNGKIDLDNTNLQALAGGAVNLDAANSVTVSQTRDLIIGTLKAGNNEQINLSSNNAITFNEDITTGSMIIANAGKNLTLNADLVSTSTSAHAIQLSAGDHFINTAGGDALTTDNSNWAVYSNNKSATQLDDLSADQTLNGQSSLSDAITQNPGSNLIAYGTAQATSSGTNASGSIFPDTVQQTVQGETFTPVDTTNNSVEPSYSVAAPEIMASTPMLVKAETPFVPTNPITEATQTAEANSITMDPLVTSPTSSSTSLASAAITRQQIVSSRSVSTPVRTDSLSTQVAFASIPTSAATTASTSASQSISSLPNEFAAPIAAPLAEPLQSSEEASLASNTQKKQTDTTEQDISAGAISQFDVLSTDNMVAFTQSYQVPFVNDLVLQPLPEAVDANWPQNGHVTIERSQLTNVLPSLLENSTDAKSPGPFTPFNILLLLISILGVRISLRYLTKKHL